MRNRPILSTTKMVLLLCCAFSINGCEVADDQTQVTPQQWSVVNPPPDARDFVKNNANHRLLVAVIDTGFDYNHPLTRDSYHFSLDPHGKPTGLGYDFIGSDNWPAPYIANTVENNPEAPQINRELGKQVRENIETLLKSFSSYREFLNPQRQLQQEMNAKAFHGTFLSYLLTYDDPRIGILPYRILPSNEKFLAGRLNTTVNYDSAFAADMKSAVERAIQAGAKVISLSLYLPAIRSTEKEFALYLDLKREWEKLIQQHSDVVFVGGAGNEGAWVDGISRLSLPCGISAPNIVCVGYLSQAGDLGPYTNILISGDPFILAPGDGIQSIFPLETCGSSDKLWRLLQRKPMEPPWFNSVLMDHWKQEFESQCGQQNYISLSGSSVSVAFVARALAQIRIDHPTFDGVASIQNLLNNSNSLKRGSITFSVLNPPKPSAYPGTEPQPWGL